MGTDFGGTGTRKSLVLTHPSKEHLSLLVSWGGGDTNIKPWKLMQDICR